MKRDAPKNIPVLPHTTSAYVGERRLMTRGDEFSVKGEGRFKFLHIFTPDGSVTAWGPVNSQNAQFRSFLLDDVAVIHRPKKSK